MNTNWTAGTSWSAAARLGLVLVACLLFASGCTTQADLIALAKAGGAADAPPDPPEPEEAVPGVSTELHIPKAGEAGPGPVKGFDPDAKPKGGAGGAGAAGAGGGNGAAPAGIIPEGGAKANNPLPGAGPPAAGDAVKAEAGVGVKGQGLGGDYISAAVHALFTVEQRLVFEVQIPQAVALYATGNNDIGPQSHDEFVKKIIEPNGIDLPELPPGDSYFFDPKLQQLMVKQQKK